jgi:hypothetical protein
MTQTAPDNALGRIAAGDTPVLETLLEMNLDAMERSGLDSETYLLVRPWNGCRPSWSRSRPSSGVRG